MNKVFDPAELLRLAYELDSCAEWLRDKPGNDPGDETRQQGIANLFAAAAFLRTQRRTRKTPPDGQQG